MTGLKVTAFIGSLAAIPVAGVAGSLTEADASVLQSTLANGSAQAVLSVVCITLAWTHYKSTAKSDSVNAKREEKSDAQTTKILEVVSKNTAAIEVGNTIHAETKEALYRSSSVIEKFNEAQKK